jgi:hypothetical protein
MARPLIPPRGVFVPVALIYERLIPPVALHTWVQLRGLAWAGRETPSLSLQQLEEITGKSQSAIYGHMAILRSWGAVRRAQCVGVLL